MSEESHSHDPLPAGDEFLADEAVAEPFDTEDRPEAEPVAAVAPQHAPSSRVTWLLIFLVVLALVRWNVATVVEDVQYAMTRGRQRAESVGARAQLAKLEDTSSVFRLVAQSVGPSVVHIETLQETGNGGGSWLFPGPMQATGQGSGVIVDSEGYLLTNYHVIKGASAVDVKLSDGRTIHKAEVVGVDPPTDLAVLKIDADSLVAAPWGESDDLKVGDWVLAVGNPFGLDRSVTAGIVSAKGRRNVVRNMPYQDFLQTDAAVNPGNSGGPLVNLKGEMVGITTAIVGESYQGVGFAIPSSLVRDVYDRLRSAGRYSRGWLGVAMQEITAELAAEKSIPREGVMVLQVVGGPARQAGLQIEDVILMWDGVSVESPTDLSLKVARTKVDTSVPVTIRRDGAELVVNVKVGERQF